MKSSTVFSRTKPQLTVQPSVKFPRLKRCSWRCVQPNSTTWLACDFVSLYFVPPAVFLIFHFGWLVVQKHLWLFSCFMNIQHFCVVGLFCSHIVSISNQKLNKVSLVICLSLTWSLKISWKRELYLSSDLCQGCTHWWPTLVSCDILTLSLY